MMAVFLLSGCSVEQKLARSFLENAKPTEYLLLAPTVILKYNLDHSEIPGSIRLRILER
jgi:hypothetical protein